jgi:hypothetical protein
MNHPGAKEQFFRQDPGNITGIKPDVFTNIFSGRFDQDKRTTVPIPDDWQTWLDKHSANSNQRRRQMEDRRIIEEITND